VYRIDEYPSTLSHRYHLLGVIGAGGMGMVWKAHDEILNRQVACKTLAGDDPLFQQRFESEARHIASLSHPNIVKLFDAGTEGALAYLVMEYVRGVSLRQILKVSTTLPINVVSSARS
jgi:eukaryotic-like serine/threonine-protein kinase